MSPILLFALGTAGLAGPLAAQQGRLIRGQVLAAADSTPVAAASVGAVGTAAATVTDSSGRFALVTPWGAARLTIRGIGITPDTVTLPAGTDTIRIFVLRLAVLLPPVNVEARAAARVRFDSVAQTSTITLSPRDIASAPGLLEADLVRAVQLLPGTVARNDYSIGYNVRGGESDQNLVRLDGVTILNPSHLAGLFSTFDVNAVDHVDFLTGGFPAEYSGRLSSVLDVSLRPGNHERVHGSGAVTLLSSKALLEGPLGRASFLLGARRTYADQAVKAFTSETFPYSFTDLVGKLDLPYGARGDVAVTGYWGRDILTLNLLAAKPDQLPIDLDFGWGNGLLGIRWLQPVGVASLEQRLSVTTFSSNLDLTPNLVRYRNPATLWSFGSTLSLESLRHHAIRFGIGFERYDLSYSVTNPAIPNELGSSETTVTAAFFNTRYRPAVAAAFLDDQWRPSPAVLIRAGVRAEHVTRAARTEFGPRAAFKVFLSPSQAITGSAGRYYQVVQSLADRDLPISIYEFWVGADGRVPVAHSDHLVAGYERWFGPSIEVSVEGYRKTFADLIRPNSGLALRDTGDVFLPVQGEAWGVDVLLRRHAGAVRGWIAYSFVHAIRRSAGEEYPPAQDRRSTLNVVIQAPGPLKSDCGLRFGFGSPLPYTALLGSWDHGQYSATYGTFTGAQNEPVGGAMNGARYPSYARFDLGLRWRGRRWGLTWEPYLNVVNVLDRRNVFAYFFNTDNNPPTRTAFYQLPVLVAGGVDFSW